MVPRCLPTTRGVLQHYRELQTCRKAAFTIPTEQTKHLVGRGDKKQTSLALFPASRNQLGIKKNIVAIYILLQARVTSTCISGSGLQNYIIIVTTAISTVERGASKNNPNSEEDITLDPRPTLGERIAAAV